MLYHFLHNEATHIMLEVTYLCAYMLNIIQHIFKFVRRLHFIRNVNAYSNIISLLLCYYIISLYKNITSKPIKFGVSM